MRLDLHKNEFQMFLFLTELKLKIRSVKVDALLCDQVVNKLDFSMVKFLLQFDRFKFLDRPVSDYDFGPIILF